MDDTKDQVKDAASQMKEQAGQVTDQVKEQASKVTDTAKDQAESRVSDQKDRAANGLVGFADALSQVSDNMRDAQGYLSPIILGLTLPFAVMISAVLQNPDGPLPRIMSWIPLYSPFAMMARLGSGVSPWEVAGSAAVLAAFIALELILLGRLFRASILQAGQPMRLRRLGRLFAPERA